MKHKVIFLLTIAMVAGVSLKAQLNVGSTAPADVSAILQATSTTKGFLPPVMTTAQINAILLPANGLTVYNSTLSQLQVNVGTTFVPSWSVVAGGANVYWSQQGNTGTVPGTNYIGTTDNASIGFRTNGVERVRIDSATGNVGIGTINTLAKLDVAGNMRLATALGGATTDSILTINATTGIVNKRTIASIANQTGFYFADGTLTSNRIVTQVANTLSFLGTGGILLKSGTVNFDSSALIGKGDSLTGGALGIGVTAYGGLNLGQNNGSNIFIGYKSGKITTGTNNVFNGYQSGQNNTTGIGNVFTGYKSGLSNSTGSNNVFSGYQSGQANTTATGNVFIGSNTGSATTTGTYNTFTGSNSGNFNTTGSLNVFTGNLSGQANTTGSNNTFSGSTSGYTNTTGSNNVFTGIGSGQNNTTANGNVFTGYQSGWSNTTGTLNVFSGNLSGFNNTTASSNVFIGSNSGGSNTIGSNNTFTGTNSGNFNTTGSLNVFTGNLSGQANTTGSNNTFSGSSSGYSNTTGSNNVFSGISSGQNNTTANGNVFTGYLSGYSNTSGILNVFSGNQSGQSNTTASSNVFMGSNSGQLNTTGSNNTFIGSNSGNLNTTGSFNVFTGNLSGQANTVGSSNTFSGNTSGYSNTTGTSNVFLGFQAGQSNTIGNSNVFTGQASGYNNTTGVNNTFNGQGSGLLTTTGTNNVFMGVQSGQFNTTGINNSAIGPNAGPLTGALTNTTSLGYNTQATQSNTVILGNGANVGIGTTTPSQPLQVNGVIKSGLDNNGSILLSPGNGSQAGYLRFNRGDGVTSPGYIGYDNTDLYYRAENGAQHRFSGNNVIVENMLNVGGAATVGSGGLPAQGGGTGFTWNTYEGGFGESEFVNFSGAGPGGFRFYRVYGGNTTNSGNWTAFINSGGAYSQVSDERTKTNIKTVANGLSTIMALHPISYNLHLDRTIKNGMVTFGKNDEISKQFGFSAQEMYKVIPEAVDKPKDVANDFYSVNYTAVIPILTKAIQEQQVQIATQTGLIKQQQAQNDKQVSISKALQLEIALLKKDNLDIVTQLSEMNELKLAVAQLRSELNKTTITKVNLPLPVTVN